MEEMKRARLTGYKNIQIETVKKPEPQENEVLIRVKKCGVCGSDISAYYGKHTYINFPIVLGHEFTGEIVEMGSNVTGFCIGDRVTVLPHAGCGECKACRSGKYNLCNKLLVLGCQITGAYAEYVTAPAKVTFKIPPEISFEMGALIEPAAVGYHGAKRAVAPGDNVLVMGAGAIGIFAMQGAKALGAEKVIVCDYNSQRLELARDLGAAGIIDMSSENIESRLDELTGGAKTVNCFIDCVGFKGSAMSEIIRLAGRGAKVVSIGIIENNYDIPNLPDITEHELTLYGSSMYWPEDFTDVIKLMMEGKIRVDGIISHWYKISDIAQMFEMIDKHEESFMKIMLDIDFDN